MKVIDLINMMNNKEELPERMIINKRNFHSNVFKSMIYEEDCNTNIWMAINLQHIDLDDKVKLIEDKTIEDEIDIQTIEEIEDSIIFRVDNFKGEINKSYLCDLLTRQNTYINKILQWAKQTDKEIKSIKEK